MPHVYTETSKWPKTLANVIVFRPKTGERSIVAHGLDPDTASKVAAELRGALADAYHTGAAETASKVAGRRARTPSMDAEERWYALNDGWV